MRENPLTKLSASPALTRFPRTLPLHLAATVGANAQNTAVSQHITLPYSIRQIVIYFPPGCDNLVQVTPILALDDSVSTSGLPPGYLLLTEFSQTPYILGDDAVIPIPLDHRVETKGTWLKLFLDNSDLDAHTISATLSLYELLEIP